MSHTSDSTIHKFISKLHLPLYFSRPVNRHIADFIAGATQKGYRGKIQDIVTYYHPYFCHL